MQGQEQACRLLDLPSELQLKILSLTPEYGPLWHNDTVPLTRCLPFTTYDDDRNEDPLQGFRVVPFIAQVCRKWKELLATRQAQELLYSHVVLDFGHEILNGVFYPLKFQSGPMTEDEFSHRLAACTLSVPKMQRHVRQLREFLTGLTINVEGLWHRFLQGDRPIGEHCSFDEGDLCFMLGAVSERLQELNVHNRHGRLRLECSSGFWTSVAACTRLQRLHVHGQGEPVMHISGVPEASLSALSALGGLRELQLTSVGGVVAAVRALPLSWSRLTRLTSLELSMPSDHVVLPSWLRDLPLRRLCIGVQHMPSLDLEPVNEWTRLSYGDLSVLTALTGLEVLALQDSRISDMIPQPPDAPEPPGSPLRPLWLPDLALLASSLRAVSLPGTLLTRLPPQIFRLTGLELLDLRDSPRLWVLGDMTPLLAQYPHLRLLDLRGVTPWHASAAAGGANGAAAAAAGGANGAAVAVAGGANGGAAAGPAGAGAAASASAELSLPVAYTQMPALTVKDLHWLPEASGLWYLLYGELWSLFQELRVMHGIADNWRVDPEQRIPGLIARLNSEDLAEQVAAGKLGQLGTTVDLAAMVVPGHCERRMRGYLRQARALLQNRRGWQPGPGRAALEDEEEGGEGLGGGGGREEAWAWLPQWRRPSAGGKHGPGPWLLLDEEPPDLVAVGGAQGAGAHAADPHAAG